MYRQASLLSAETEPRTISTKTCLKEPRLQVSSGLLHIVQSLPKFSSKDTMMKNSLSSDQSQLRGQILHLGTLKSRGLHMSG